MPAKLQQITIYILGAFLVIGGVVFAGLLAPSVGTDTSTFYTLEDIFQRLQDNNFSPSSHLLSATNPPTPSMHNLSDIYGSITPFYNTAFNLGSSTGYSLGYSTGINIGSSTGYSTGYDAGLATNPAENNVRSSIAYGNGQIGTIVLPDISKVLASTNYGAGGTEYTGALIVPSIPSESNVLIGVHYGDNGIQYTGNVVLPSAGSVISTATFGSNSGTTGTITVKTGDNAVTDTSVSTNKLLLTVPAGYYGGSATVSTTSTAFSSVNIAFGVNLFGVVGDYTGPIIEWYATDYIGDSDHAQQTDWNTGYNYCLGLGGGWRLPTYQELVTKFLDSNGTPSGFVSGPSGNYWSNTDVPNSSSHAYIVYMGTDALALNGFKISSYGYVRCVR